MKLELDKVLLPTVGLRAGSGVEKVGRYTSQGAGIPKLRQERIS
jgi:hypothetical protein